MNSMQCEREEHFARFVPLRFALPFVPRSVRAPLPAKSSPLYPSFLQPPKAYPSRARPASPVHGPWPRPPVLCFLEASPIQPRTTAARLPMRPAAARSIPRPLPPSRTGTAMPIPTQLADNIAPRLRPPRFAAFRPDKIPRPFCRRTSALKERRSRGGGGGGRESRKELSLPPAPVDGRGEPCPPRNLGISRDSVIHPGVW